MGVQGVLRKRTMLLKNSSCEVAQVQISYLQREREAYGCPHLRLRGLIQVLTFTECGVHARFEKENLTFTGEDSPMSHLLLSVMGAFAQFERDLIRERQGEGIALAKLREGTYTGRKHSLSAAQAKELCRRIAGGEADTALARELRISRQTLYRYAERARK